MDVTFLGSLGNINGNLALIELWMPYCKNLYEQQKLGRVHYGSLSFMSTFIIVEGVCMHKI